MGRHSKKLSSVMNKEKENSNKKSKAKIEEESSKSNHHSDESKAKVFYELANCYRNMGKWLNSADAFEKTLDIYKRLKDYPKVAEVELDLGEMLIRGEKLDKAKSIFKKYLKARPSDLKEVQYSGVASDGMGKISMKLGKNSEAEEHFKFSLSLSKKYIGENIELAGFTKNNLSAVYLGQGKLNEAEKHMTEALKIFNSQTQNNSEMRFEVKEAIATLNNNLGLIYSWTGRYAEAELHCKEAIKLFGTMPDDEHCRNVATALNNCGYLNFRQKKYAEAKKYYTKALKVAKSTKYHVKIAEIQVNFGVMYMTQEKPEPEEAEKKFRKALQIQRWQFGAESEQVLKTRELLKNVAGCQQWIRFDPDWSL